MAEVSASDCRRPRSRAPVLAILVTFDAERFRRLSDLDGSGRLRKGSEVRGNEGGDLSFVVNEVVGLKRKLDGGAVNSAGFRLPVIQHALLERTVADKLHNRAFGHASV